MSPPEASGYGLARGPGVSVSCLVMEARDDPLVGLLWWHEAGATRRRVKQVSIQPCQQFCVITVAFCDTNTTHGPKGPQHLLRWVLIRPAVSLHVRKGRGLDRTATLHGTIGITFSL